MADASDLKRAVWLLRRLTTYLGWLRHTGVIEPGSAIDEDLRHAEDLLDCLSPLQARLPNGTYMSNCVLRRHGVDHTHLNRYVVLSVGDYCVLGEGDSEQEALRSAADCVSIIDLAGPEDSIGHGSVVCVKVERAEDEGSRHN
jgi:hypothetical protein